jgi:hypothetical protein
MAISNYVDIYGTRVASGSFEIIDRNEFGRLELDSTAFTLREPGAPASDKAVYIAPYVTVGGYDIASDAIMKARDDRVLIKPTNPQPHPFHLQRRQCRHQKGSCECAALELGLDGGLGLVRQAVLFHGIM